MNSFDRVTMSGTNKEIRNFNKKKNPTKKWTKDQNIHFSEGETEMANNYTSKYLASPAIGGKQVKLSVSGMSLQELLLSKITLHTGLCCSIAH